MWTSQLKHTSFFPPYRQSQVLAVLQQVYKENLYVVIKYPIEVQIGDTQYEEVQ